jgi:Derlin-2/3
MADPLNWYFDIPMVSRCYLTGAIVVTTACFLDLVSPLTLYYNYDLIFQKGQYWRLITSYLFFGTFNVDFLFHMYFVVSNGMGVCVCVCVCVCVKSIDFMN